MAQANQVAIEIVVLTPLAPTKLTFFPDLEHGRQGVAESQFDRIGRELVLHPLEAHDVCAHEQCRR